MARGTDAVAVIAPQSSGLGQDVTVPAQAKALPLLSESMSATPTIYGSQALRKRAMRTRNLARLGTLDVGGTLEIEGTNQSLHELLPLVFPVKEDSSDPDFDGSTKLSRTYKASTADEQDYFTVFLHDGDVRRIFRDCRVNSMTLQADINQLGRFSFDISGVRAEADTTSLTATIPSVEYGLYFEQAKVELGDSGGTLAEVPAQSFTLTVNRNLDTGRYRLGSRFKRNLPGGLFEVTGSVTLDANPLQQKDKLYKAVLNAEWMALKFSFVDPTNKVGGQDSKLVIDLPYVLVEWPQHNITGPEAIQGAVNFTAYDDETLSPTFLHQYKLG